MSESDQRWGRIRGGFLWFVLPLVIGILASALRRPFGSRRVLALIHWQALKLWWKGAGFHHRPAPPADEVSR
jgi:DUF1365 family protein